MALVRKCWLLRPVCVLLRKCVSLLQLEVFPMSKFVATVGWLFFLARSSENVPPWDIDPIIEDICFLAKNCNLSFSFVTRDSNSTAQYIAGLARKGVCLGIGFATRLPLQIGFCWARSFFVVVFCWLKNRKMNYVRSCFFSLFSISQSQHK